MRRTAPLNERQLHVLRWIADGCPANVMDGQGHKATARALSDRGLARISRPEGKWSAELTDDGRYYLEHGQFPVTRSPVKLRPRAQRTQPTREATRSGIKSSEHSSGVRKPAPPRRLSRVEQLVADVVAAGGMMQRPADGDRDWDDPRQLVRNANRYGKTPPGKRLEHQVIYEGGGWYGPRFDFYTLVDGPAGVNAPLEPVPVPADVARYHSAVSALRKAKRLRMAQDVQTRALRILHGLAVEAERRGLDVAAHTPKSDQHQPVAWHLLLSSDGETVPLKIDEESDRVKHVPTPREVKEHERHPWMSIPTHDQVPSGRLRIDIGTDVHSERRSFWADRASWRLEDKLPELLREVSVRINELRMRREAKVKAEQEYRQAVELETERARARADEAHRAKILEQQLTDWRIAQELREYASAISQRVAAAPAEGETQSNAVADARRWCEWITERADRHDPLRRLPTWPAVPRLHDYQLREFMNRVPEPEQMRYRPEAY
jgi:hypothetical protein